MMNRTKRRPKKPLATAKKRVYTLEVALLGGPITKKFARKNRTIMRTIAEGTQRVGRPKVTQRVGESPPQYMDWDEEG